MYAHFIADSLSLAEALGRLPIKVQVLRMTSHETAKLDLSGQTLLLRSVDDNVFLRANAINGGKEKEADF